MEVKKRTESEGKTINEIVIETLKTIPKEVFSNWYDADNSIYIYLDRHHYYIDRKGKGYVDKKTDKRITYELTSEKIYRTREETIEKFKAEIGKEQERSSAQERRRMMALEQKKLDDNYWDEPQKPWDNYPY